jgi:MtrB/PioB family decaheme-associated outer membrane protein
MADKTRQTALILLPILALSSTVAAQTVDTSEWTCEYCPFEDGHRADYTVGATAADEDSAYFGNASGYDEKGGYLNLDGDGSYAGDQYRMRWTAEDLGLDSRYAAIETGRPGRYGIALAYRELPRRKWITTESIFDEASGDSLSLPSGWVRAPLTSGFTQLDSSLAPRNIESDRRFFDVGGSFLAFDALSITADYRRQTNDGLKVYGGSGYSNASLLPMPLDYVTDEVELGLRYALGAGYVSLDWYLSDFDNQNTALNWQTPFTAAPGADSPALAQAPDSKFQQLRLKGGYRFPAARTSLSASVAVGTIDQNTAFLPYTVNPNLSPGALPRSNLGGSVDTSNYALSVNSRPIDKLRVRLGYRYDERDNQTPVEVWERVVVDTLLSSDPENNLPYSFQRSSLELTGDYDLTDSLRVSGGYERRETERDLQEVREQTEDSGWGRLRWRATDYLEIDGRAGAASREIDSYNEVVAATFGQNPLMRKYNLAYRYREFAELAFTLMPTGVPLTLTLEGRYADDDYTRSQIGLVAGREMYVGADIGWAFSERASVYLNLSAENIESDQRGSEAFAAADWQASNDDDYATVGAGFRVRQIADKVDLQLDWTHADSASSIVLDEAVGSTSIFPDLETALDIVRVRFNYRHSERVDVTASLTYQAFEAEDWSIEGVGPGTIAEVLSLGALPYDDEQLLFGIGFSYRLGQDSETQ